MSFFKELFFTSPRVLHGGNPFYCFLELCDWIPDKNIRIRGDDRIRFNLELTLKEPSYLIHGDYLPVAHKNKFRLSDLLHQI